ncbi:putative phytosulfokines 6, partial [Mucuna pruriens]
MKTKVGAIVGFKLKTKVVNGSFIYLFLSSTFFDACSLRFSSFDFDPSLVVSHSHNIEPMKQQIVLLFSLLLLSSFLASARLLEPPKGPRQGEKEGEVNDNAIPQSSAELEDDMEELMGVEECCMKEEECSRRRMMVEAHLDYIYTQHHNP